MPSTRGNSKNNHTPVLPKIRDRSVNSPNSSALSGLSEEGRIMFRFQSDKLDRLIGAKDKKIETLEHENATLRRDMCRMEERIENLEMYERRNEIVISGAAVPGRRVGENVAQVVVDTLKQQMNYTLPNDTVFKAHRMAGKPDQQVNNNGNILVRLSNETSKRDLIQACKTSKPDQLYINDNLTPTRSEILYALRRAKRRFPDKIGACGSLGGRVFIWVKAPVSTNRDYRIFISSKHQLDDFWSKSFGISLGELLK